MNFKFNSDKTVEAAAMFLKLHGKPMKYMGLIKLLYMADRMALGQTEQPITGDKYVSMNHGPVLSGVLDLISHGPIYNENNPWFKYISPPENYSVKLLDDPGVDELCEEEEDIIREIYRDYGHYDRFYLAQLTHQLFSEWQNPYGSAIPIRVEDILWELGKTIDAIEEIRREVEKENYLDIILNG